MTETEFQTMLEEKLYGTYDDDPVAEVVTFENAGLLTRNKGLEVRMDDGSVFQVQIIKSA